MKIYKLFPASKDKERHEEMLMNDTDKVRPHQVVPIDDDDFQDF